MTRIALHRAALIAALGGLLIAGSICVDAQNTAQNNAQQPTFRAGANFVRVDVYPTLKGAAVRDLVQGDFEILEDGVPQKIESFEYVNVRGAGSEAGEHEPNTVAEARQIAETTKGRLFVIFLDTYFIDVAGSHLLQRTLVNFLHSILGPDDLYAVMTPDMSALDISFARRTDTIEGYLSKYWFWGQRDRLFPTDPVEQSYFQCFPEDKVHTQFAGVAREMVQRRRERQVLGALQDLAVYLRGVREERKAIITMTGGWVLFRENPHLTLGGSGESNLPRVGTTPDGRLSSDAHKYTEGYSQHDCEVDRQRLAALDNWQFFHDMFDVANRSNVTFYPVNALGLVAFDKPIGDQPTLEGEIRALGPAAHVGEDPNVNLNNPMVTDTALISQRRDNLRSLAENTDGLAVVDTNDIDTGMKRIVDDLTSYYLLGYTSTNGKLDGRYRKISVRVKRSGVDVRARRGYRAATEKEVELGRMAEAKRIDSAPPTTMQVALNALGSARPGIPLHTSVSYATLAGSTAEMTKAHLWALVELDNAVLRQSDWMAGGSVESTLLGADGTAVASKATDLPAGEHAVAIDMGEFDSPDGEVTVRTRITPKNGGLPYTDTIRLGKVESPGRPILLRRGPSTGIKYVPTANPQFQRTERVRVDLAVSATQQPFAEVLDRTGKTLQVPVKTSVRTENGIAWASAEVTLAPLAPGDYLIRMKAETNGTSQEVITGFRLVP
jgi:VWFA-related protein